MRATWHEEGEDPPLAVALNIQSLEMYLLGERFDFKFVLDKEMFSYPMEVECLASQLSAVTNQAIVRALKKKMEQV